MRHHRRVVALVLALAVMSACRSLETFDYRLERVTRTAIEASEVAYADQQITLETFQRANVQFARLAEAGRVFTAALRAGRLQAGDWQRFLAVLASVVGELQGLSLDTLTKASVQDLINLEPDVQEQGAAP